MWHNPIAWREAATRATEASKGIIRYAITGGGIVAGGMLLYEYHGGLNADDTRFWLAGIVTIEFAIILLIATNTAATTITKERESQTMDILLTTPLLAKDLVWGKLRGLVSFTIPPMCVPVVTAAGVRAVRPARPHRRAGGFDRGLCRAGHADASLCGVGLHGGDALLVADQADG